MDSACGPPTHNTTDQTVSGIVQCDLHIISLATQNGVTKLCFPYGTQLMEFEIIQYLAYTFKGTVTNCTSMEKIKFIFLIYTGSPALYQGWHEVH